MGAKREALLHSSLGRGTIMRSSAWNEPRLFEPPPIQCTQLLVHLTFAIEGPAESAQVSITIRDIERDELLVMEGVETLSIRQLTNWMKTAWPALESRMLSHLRPF